jgi:hypothetical protein
MALMRCWPLFTIFLTEVTLKTCFKGRTVVLVWRSTGDAETAAAARVRAVTKNMA